MLDWPCTFFSLLQTFLSSHRLLHSNSYSFFQCSISTPLFSFSISCILTLSSFVVSVFILTFSFFRFMPYFIQAHYLSFQTSSKDFIVFISSFSSPIVQPLKAHPYSLTLTITNSHSLCHLLSSYK